MASTRKKHTYKPYNIPNHQKAEDDDERSTYILHRQHLGQRKQSILYLIFVGIYKFNSYFVGYLFCYMIIYIDINMVACGMCPALAPKAHKQAKETY